MDGQGSEGWPVTSWKGVSSATKKTKVFADRSRLVVTESDLGESSGYLDRDDLEESDSVKTKKGCLQVKRIYKVNSFRK